MNNTRRLFPVITLVGLFLVSLALASSLVEQNQFLFFLLFFLVGLLLWISWMGGGLRMAEKDIVVIVEDFMQNASEVRHGTYMFIPILQTIEAKMPSYPLRHEFEVDSIDTQTPGLQQIKKIKVRITYEIVNFLTCFDHSTDVKERVKQLEIHEKLHTDDPALWTRVLNEVMRGIIDDAIRDGVWKWAEAVLNDPELKLDMPSLPNPVKNEHEPYTLSLNRTKLSEKILEEVRFRAQRWGLKVHRIVFENIDLDLDMIKGKTRDKQRELDEATHEAKKTAIAIREKGLAEAEIRAVTVAKIIDVLMNQKGISVTDQVLYNIVRAAMYSDGQMIWNATMDKGANSNVKAA